MNKKALYLNIALVLFEIIGLIWSMVSKGAFVSFKFYTNLSNVLALVAGIMFILEYYLVKNNVFKNISSYVKFISTIGLTVTFLVVLFVLGPDGAKTNGVKGYMDYLLPNGLIFLHVLCPIVEVISFVFFEDHKNFNKPYWYILAALYTFVYGIIVITIVYFSDVKAPYFFLNSKSMGYWVTFGYGMLFVLATGLISLGLVNANKKIYKD